MKRLYKILPLICACFFLYSCSNEGLNDKTINNNTIDSYNEDVSHIYFPVKTFSKYEIFNSNSFDSDFDKTMLQNPLDSKLHAELNTLNSAGTREYQVLLSKYNELWKDEISFSVSNLNSYLSKEQIESFNKAQVEWEQSLSQDVTFDQNLINDKGISFGTQYVPSSLINGIGQYRERVFYIKYLTMLCENYTAVEVPTNEQLWDVWLIEKHKE